MLLPFLLLLIAIAVTTTRGFVPAAGVFKQCATTGRCSLAFVSLCSSKDDKSTDEEGKSLAEEFSKFAKMEGIELNDDDLLDEDEDDDEEETDDVSASSSSSEEEDDEEVNIPQGAINAFLGWDSGDVGDKLKGNVTLTNDQLYSEVKERVLDTAGGFAKLVGGASDEDEEEDGEPKRKEYKPPTTVPDSGLTAGEVVETVLDALLHNDVPTTNRGLEILFEYSSPTSQIKTEQGLTPQEYGDYLKETEYKVLFQHDEVVVDKGDYSFDGKKAFYTARLRVGPGPLDFTPVNFILSTLGQEEDDCWLIDSMLIRPSSMRRRRRR